MIDRHTKRSYKQSRYLFTPPPPRVDNIDEMVCVEVVLTMIPHLVNSTTTKTKTKTRSTTQKLACRRTLDSVKRVVPVSGADGQYIELVQGVRFDPCPLAPAYFIHVRFNGPRRQEVGRRLLSFLGRFREEMERRCIDIYDIVDLPPSSSSSLSSCFATQNEGTKKKKKTRTTTRARTREGPGSARLVYHDLSMPQIVPPMDVDSI